MTSWFQAQRKTEKAPREQAYTFEVTNSEGFCAQFNNYLYSYLTTKEKNRILYVFDKNNAISPTFSLINSTFLTPEDVKITDISTLQYQKLSLNQTFPVTRDMPLPKIKAAASKLFEIKPEMLEECNAFLEPFSLPSTFDIGVHIRAGDKITKREMGPISINSYIDAIKKFQVANSLKEMTVFVMTDTYKSFESLKEKADPSWKLYTVDSSEQTGYNHGEYRQLPLKQRKAAYVKFLSELLLMRSIRAIVCTLSSNVGRWLYVNIHDDSYLKSLDTPSYATI
jgi:hypothetical protein